MEQEQLTQAEIKKLRRAREKLHTQPPLSPNPVWVASKAAFYYLVLLPLFKWGFGSYFHLKIRNRDRMKQIRGQGCILISNHVHPLDCTFIGAAASPRQIIYTSQEETFYIRGLRSLLRFCNCVPILKDSAGLCMFSEEMEKQLKNGKTVTMYPEGTIDVCCDHLRTFRLGAFMIASKAGVPIVPMIITPRKPTGIWKLLRKDSYCVTIEVGEPILPPAELEHSREKALWMRKTAIERMNHLLEIGDHDYPKRNMNDPNAFWQVRKSKQI